MSRLSKLWRKSPREIAWRLGQTARIQRDRLQACVRTPSWDRAALLNVLAPAVIDPVLRTHLKRGDWRAAHRSLGRALRARPRTFVLDPTSAPTLRQRILDRWPDASADASQRADRILAGRYDLLGYRNLSYSGANGHIDWHFDPVHQRRAPRAFWANVPTLDAERVGDHKVIWEINRHQHWLALGRALWLTRDRRYAWAIVSQLDEWMTANLPLVGINWASALELGFRSMSWVWALHFLIADTADGAAGPAQKPWLIDLLLGLDRQLRHIEENLSHYFSPNTHITGEALALYVVGLSVPELANSARWVETGRRILLEQIGRQIGADGGHFERSLHYHHYTLDFYLLALLLAQRSQDTEAVTPFTDAVTRLAEFAHTTADHHGRIPLIGDDDGGKLWPIAGRPCADIRDSLALAGVVLRRPDLARWGVPEEVFWIAGQTALDQEPFIEAYRPDAAPPPSATFPDTGYVVARDEAGDHLIFDVGEHGCLNGGHAHADALSVTLSLGGRPLLVDPGTATYTADPALRDRMRSGASHNTLTLNGRSSSVPAGPFHWQSQANARLGAARHNPAFDWAEAWHDGYESHLHRRTIFRAPAGGWLIVDEVLGRGLGRGSLGEGGRQTADLSWHFDPSWIVNRETATRLRATHAEGDAAWIVHDGDDSTLWHGDESTGLGWFAPVYGTLVPTSTARVSREAVAPFSIATWITDSSIAPTLLRLTTECDPGGSTPLALRVLEQDVVWTTILRPGEPTARETRGCAAGAYHTNGRLLHYGSRDGRLISLAACDASHVLALREGWLSVSADEPIPDLYVNCAGETIDIWSSAPPARLRLQGALVSSARSMRMNGRQLPAHVRERTDTVVVLPSQGGEPRRMTPCVA
jgi:uncharacterized heparinase superfamily protein